MTLITRGEAWKDIEMSNLYRSGENTQDKVYQPQSRNDEQVSTNSKTT